MALAKKRWRRVAVTGLVGAVLIGTLSACQDVDGSPDNVKCIYNNETGALDGDPMMPGSARRDNVDSDYKVISIPTSDRFWNISPTDSRDAAAPQFLVARDASYKETRTVIEVGFRFNADKACKWYDQHGRRDTGNTGGDPQFNITGQAGTPWQQWLNRNFTSLEDRINQDLVRKYSWEYLEFNFPTNADKNGLLPDLPDKDPKDNVPPAKVEPALQTLRQIEIDFGKELSKQLTAALGDQYFCGIDYKIGGECTSLLVKITSINLTDQKPVDDRKALIAQAEANTIAQEQAKLTKDGTQAAVDARQAEADKQKLIDEINAQADIDKANSQKAVADAQRAAESSEAAKQVAPCIQAGVGGADCAELLSVLAGKGLRPTVGGVTVQPGG